MFISTIGNTEVYRDQVESVQVVISRLSEQINQPISVSNQFKGDLLFVRPRNAPPEAILKLVATSLGASIVKTAKGLTLTRTREDLQALRAVRSAERESWITRRLAGSSKFRKTFDAAETDVVTKYFKAIEAKKQTMADVLHGVKESKPYGPGDLLPVQSLLESIVEKIGIAKLAKLPSATMAVFEDNPSFDSQSLPDCSDLIAKFNFEMNSIRGASLSAEQRKLAQSVYEQQSFDSISATPPIVKLRLEVIPDQNSIDFELECFDSAGKCVQRKSMWAGPTDVRSVPKVYLRLAKAVPNTRWKLFSQTAGETVSIARGDTLKPLQEWYLHPDLFEPLNLFVREGVSALADQSDKPFVMEVSDALWINIRQCTEGGRLNLDALESTMRVWPLIFLKQQNLELSRAQRTLRQMRDAVATDAY